MIPQRILILWHEHKLPKLVERCVANVKRMCPTFTVQVLSFREALRILEETMPPFFAEQRTAIQADWIRAKWMQTFGGVYIDATCFLTRPLETWIDFDSDKFVAFETPSNEDVCELWFLAAPAQHEILTAWVENIHRLESCGWYEFSKQCTKLPRELRIKYHMCGAALHQARYGKKNVLLQSFPKGPLQFLSDIGVYDEDMTELLGYSHEILQSMNMVKLTADHREFLKTHASQLKKSNVMQFLQIS